MSDETQLNINQIMAMIPHRYPMLLVDKVIDIVKGESATGIKNVTINEPVFQGHFPKRPIFPGVMIVEAMAQTAGLVAVDFLGEEARGKLVYFMSIEDARFRKPVEPGDVLLIHVAKLQKRKTVWKFKCEAKVDGHLCAGAVVSAMILDSEF